jgi:hypothetical protein
MNPCLLEGYDTIPNNIHFPLISFNTRLKNWTRNAFALATTPWVCLSAAYWLWAKFLIECRNNITTLKYLHKISMWWELNGIPSVLRKLIHNYPQHAEYLVPWQPYTGQIVAKNSVSIAPPREKHGTSLILVGLHQLSTARHTSGN